MTGVEFRDSRPLVIGYGDSNTKPNFLDSNWVDYAEIDIGTGYYVRNAGIGGDTAEDMIARYTSYVGNWFFRSGFCVILAGLNDDQDGATVAQIYDRLDALCDSASATGYLVVLCTYPVEDNLMFSVNDSIQANPPANADTILDCGADAYIGEASDHSDTDWWFNTRHFSLAGHERFAETYVVPAIQGLL